MDLKGLVTREVTIYAAPTGMLQTFLEILNRLNKVNRQQTRLEYENQLRAFVYCKETAATNKVTGSMNC